VLVDEDNPDVREFAFTMLSEPGYATVGASDGRAALYELAETPDGFDLVFSDVMMPGRTGIELGREIRMRYSGLPLSERLQGAFAELFGLMISQGGLMNMLRRAQAAFCRRPR